MIKTFRLTGPLRTLNNRQVRAPKGRRRAGRGRPDREGGVCLRGANTAGEGAHAGLFYSKIPAIFEELS
ncbi:MAG: hypothetical protein DMG87_17510 [Acidobacteria bacterium]|nr:MAG: hypothetical protein DMG87_17510 [Acidobacteriota bacterium]